MDAVPARVSEYADQAVAYVRRALSLPLEYDSDTLPLLDHYLRTVAESEQPAATALVIATSGAYFGEVVRRRLGGRWEIPTAEERANGNGNGNGHVVPFEGADWRVVLPTGLSFSPAGIVAAAIAQADLEDFDSEIDAPPRMRPYVQQALARMGEVSVEDYYSLCGRLDTLEHIHEVLVAVAAQMMGNVDDDVPEQALARMGEVSIEDYYSLCGRLDTLEHIHEVLVAVAAQMMGNVDDDVPEQASDEPSGPVN